MRILLVEDEPNAASVLAKGLREETYAVDVATDGDTALFRLETTDYDAVILDVMLPVLDGFALCRSLRTSGCTVPVLMLTARDSVEERIQGLDCGADDYMVKPFDFGELLARLRALVRRGRPAPLAEPLRVGSLTIDTGSRRASVGGRALALTAKEYALLEYLVRRAGTIATRSEIAEHVWDQSYDPLSNIIDVYVQRVRRKLDLAGAGSLIVTRPGKGYQVSTDPDSGG